MGYDLSLFPKDTTFSHQKFADFMSQMGKTKITEKDIVYENSLSKVYFYFDFLKEDLSLNVKNMNVIPDDDNPTVEINVEATGIEEKPIIGFSMNFFRPDYFAKEATLVLEKVVQEFDCEISDPQNNGIEGTSWNREEFLRGYTTGNHAAVKQIWEQISEQQKQELTLLCLPRQKNLALWEWNFKREDWQDELGDVYIPTIMPCWQKDKVKTLFILPPADVSFVVPETDLVIVYKSDEDKNIYVRTHQEFCEEIAKTNPIKKQGADLILPHTRASIQKFILDSPAIEPPFKFLAFDKILDSEIFDF